MLHKEAYIKNIYEMKKHRLKYHMDQEKMVKESLTKNLFDREVDGDDINVGAKIQIDMNEFYYIKFYYTHGIIVLMIGLQFLIYTFLKNREVTYFKVDEIFLNKEESEIPDGHELHLKLHRMRHISYLMDLIIMFQFWCLDYHLIIWNQTSGCFIKQGIDLRWVPRSTKCICYYY